MKTTTKLIHDQKKAENQELRKEAKADRKSMRQLIAMATKKGALIALLLSPLYLIKWVIVQLIFGFAYLCELTNKF